MRYVFKIEIFYTSIRNTYKNEDISHLSDEEMLHKPSIFIAGQAYFVWQPNQSNNGQQETWHPI